MLPCDGCAYRRSIPGGTHIICTYFWDPESTEASPLTHRMSPRVAQWYCFPFNYDPLWGPDTCAARAEIADPATTQPQHPLFDLFSILGRRL